MIISGNGTLIILDVENVSGDICFEDVILSAPDSSPYDVEVEGCYEGPDPINL